MQVSFWVTKCSKMVVVVARLSEYSEAQQTVHSKWMNYRVWQFYLNKAGEKKSWLLSVVSRCRR